MAFRGLSFHCWLTARCTGSSATEAVDSSSSSFYFYCVYVSLSLHDGCNGGNLILQTGIHDLSVRVDERLALWYG